VIPTPTLCQGIFQYVNGDGSGTTSWGPAQLKLLDPNRIGIDPAMLDPINHTGYLDRTFCTGQTPTNDLAVGDKLNYAGYVFRAPTKLDNDVFVARIDYHLTADGKHSLFWRGNLADLRNPGAPFLPGKFQILPGELNPSAPMQTTLDHSKGFAFGYAAVLNPTMVNSFHWGYTRQSFGVIGNTNQQWNQFLGLDQGITFSHNFQLPLHNFVDDFSWTKGAHSFQFGTSIKIARNPRTSFLHSNTLALGTTNWTSPIGFCRHRNQRARSNQHQCSPRDLWAGATDCNAVRSSFVVLVRDDLGRGRELQPGSRRQRGAGIRVSRGELVAPRSTGAMASIRTSFTARIPGASNRISR